MLRPFRAIRPAPALCEAIAALPYDVMSSEEAREIAKGNPLSFLRVDKAEIDLAPEIDHYDPKVYARAAENLAKMIERAELVQDGRPLFYIYRLTARDGRAQTGLVGCAAVEDYVSGRIKRHELTTCEKELDRIRHVDVCDANTGPIFLTYRARPAIDALIAEITEKTAKTYDFVADDGIGHTVWVVDGDGDISKLLEAFADVPSLYIADGHHRNASAVKVGQLRREANLEHDGTEEYNFFLAIAFPHDQLKIMDYNRLVKSLNGYNLADFIGRLSEKFDVEEIGGEAVPPAKPHEFSMYSEGKWYRLTARAGVFDGGDPVASLDVSILQDNVLAPLLGIDDPRTSREIEFAGGVRGLEYLRERVDGGEMAVAFALYPPSMSALMSVADAGEIMPPKSTWFEPKPRSGIFIHDLAKR